MVQDRIYLLDLEELKEGRQSASLFQKAKEMADAERLRKVMRIRNSAAQAASLGAGLLLQKAVAERELPAAFFQRLCVSGLVEELSEAAYGDVPAQLRYYYGEHGKPYLQDIPMQFSLSHSGRYVLCAVSEQEIGADIQQMRPLSGLRVAERFFAPRELSDIMRSEGHEARKEMFYRLWVRKEAYGKLTGEGIAAVAGQDMGKPEQPVQWLECPLIDGYQLAACKYGTGVVDS